MLDCNYKQIKFDGKFYILQCTRCNEKIEFIKENELNVKRKCKIQPKSFGSKAQTFTTAIKEHVKGGLKRAPKLLFKIRKNLCNLCQYYKKPQCLLCGCRGLKPKWLEQKCPIGKWPVDMSGQLLFNSNDQPIYLKNIYKNATCFLVCCGPSINLLNLDLLKNRGILTCAINNVAAKHIQPNIWICTDETVKFYKGIMDDPTILKLIREQNFKKHGVDQKPNCFYYRVNEDFKVKNFFTEPTVNWGNHSNLYDEYGQKGRRSTLFCAIKLLYHLGVRKIYLLGADFIMDERQPYSFPQMKWKGGVHTNNVGYSIVAERLKHLLPEMERNNLKIYNCNKQSNLKLFEFVDYKKAIEQYSILPATDKELENMYGQTPTSTN